MQGATMVTTGAPGSALLISQHVRAGDLPAALQAYRACRNPWRLYWFPGKKDTKQSALLADWQKKEVTAQCALAASSKSTVRASQVVESTGLYRGGCSQLVASPGAGGPFAPPVWLADALPAEVGGWGVDQNVS